MVFCLLIKNCLNNFYCFLQSLKMLFDSKRKIMMILSEHFFVGVLVSPEQIKEKGVFSVLVAEFVEK